MKLFCFNKGRYIDLYHVQQISQLHYKCEPRQTKKDKDGIPFDVKSYGYASFTYKLAFQTEWDKLQISFVLERRDGWDYENGCELDIDVVPHLEAFKAEYERFLAEREALDTRSVLYMPTSG